MARGKTIGTKQSLTAKYAYGDEAEISNRDKVAYQPEATSFKQISPADRGGSLNEATGSVRSGNFKYSRGV